MGLLQTLSEIGEIVFLKQIYFFSLQQYITQPLDVQTRLTQGTPYTNPNQYGKWIRNTTGNNADGHGTP